MKTAGLEEPILVNVHPQNIILTKANCKGFNCYSSEYIFKGSLSYFSEFERISKSSDIGKAIKLLHLVCYLHSIRTYFKTKVKPYFCNKCLNHFENVILLEKNGGLCNCINGSSSACLKIIDTINLFCSAVNPVDTKPYIMGCLCKSIVLKKRPYIRCGCIYSHNHLDHNNILKRIVRVETKIWKKIIDLSLLNYSSKESIVDLLYRYKNHKNLNVITPMRNISFPELHYLQIEFYKLCYPLYDKCISVNYCFGNDSVNHRKCFMSACSLKKLTYPNLRFYLRCFLSLYIKTLYPDYFLNNLIDFKLLRTKSLLLCRSYLDFLLLFGFFVYCHKVLRFPKNKSLLTSKAMSNHVDRWNKRSLLKILTKLCHSYNTNIHCIKMRSMSKYDICGPVSIQENNDQIIKYLFSNDDEIVKNKIKSLHIFKNQDKGRINLLPKLLDFGNIQYKSINVFNASNSLKNGRLRNNVFESCTKSNLLALTTGKEEVDVIDGINIFSFETEPDMMEFTLFQNKKMGIEDDYFSDRKKLSNSGRIVPTKTRDITKIKGWRNKLFCMNKSDKNHFNILKTVDATTEGLSNVRSEIKEEPSDSSNEVKNELDFTDSKDYEIDETVDARKKESDPSKLKDLFGNNSSILKYMYLHALSKDTYFQNISKLVDSSKGIFESPILDEYLTNRAELNINFEIPQPYYTLSSYSGRTSPEILSDIRMAPPKIKSEEMKEKIKQLSSIDFIKNMQGDISKRKFIWVYGRPIMLNHDDKKPTLSNSSSKKGIDSSDSLSELEDIDKDDNDVKRIKITKQLEFSDSHLSDNSESNQSDEVVDKKPYLSLLNTFQTDDIDEKCHTPSNSLKHNFPLIFPCNSINDEHTNCAKFNQIQLVMVVNIGYNRPFLREVVNNLEELKKDAVVIDNMWAHIAASAVCPNKSLKNVSRYIVPVVSEPLIEVVKFNIENVSTNIGNLNELNVRSVYRSICDSRAKKEDKADAVAGEIKDVVNDIIEYVVKRNEYESLNIPFDPDVPDPKLNIKRPVKKIKKTKVERELKRLINVTLVDNRHENESMSGKSSCGNEHCLKGCICNSLNGKLTSFHCGKLGCMFECSCDSKSKYTYKNFMLHGRNGTLAKDESSWHQTVICKNNKIVEVKAGAGKSKREKKLPTRFRNNVLLGKEMNCLDIFPSSPEHKKSPSPNKDKEIKNKDSKVKEKDVKMKDIKMKEKVVKIPEKDKEMKTKEVTISIKRNEKENKTSETSSELKNDDKCIEKVNDNCNEQDSKTVGNKISSPLKTTVKKVNVNHKALISANLNHILNQSELKKMAKMCNDERNQILTLADVFVWCSIHFRYSCSCSAQVFILKNNRLVWKPTANRTHLTSKHMSQIVINKSMPKHHIYDRNAYCARTYGSVFNYKLRNSNPVFKSKRLNEIVNNVLSNTNSFLKIDYASISNHSPKIELKLSPKIKQKLSKELDTNVTPIKMITNCGSMQLSNKLHLTPNIIHNIASEVNKKRKEPDDEKTVDLTKPGPVVVTGMKDEVVLQNVKKRYRIGPAHFDGKGSYRAISCGPPAKTHIKQASMDLVNNSKDSEGTKSLNVNETKANESIKPLPRYGLLCLTRGFGYLPVKEFTPKKLQVQDPLSEHVFHCFKDIESANKWLNRFFKNRIVFESLAVNLKWVIVKPGIMKHSKPFDKGLLENPSKIINKDGFLVDITNLNKNLSKPYVINPSIEIQQPDDPCKTRIVVNATEVKNDCNEIPCKKAKISPVSVQDKNIISSNHSIIINSNLIKNPNGFIQRKNIQDDRFGKINKTPSPNGSNHTAFFRLNSGSDSSSEGCFIPLLPKNSPKTKESSFPVKNVNENDCKEIQPSDLHVSRPSNNKSSNTISIAEFLKQSHQQNLIIKRIPKTVPFNSKTLAGKSILKTNFK